MKKFMNRMAKKEGFTLVELIVVIAILAILAGVAVPAYSAYISKANDSAAESELVNVLTAAQAAAAMKGDTVTLIEVTTGGTIKAYTGDTSTGHTEVSYGDFYTAPSNLAELISGHSEFGKTGSLGAQWIASTGKWASYTQSSYVAPSSGNK